MGNQSGIREHRGHYQLDFRYKGVRFRPTLQLTYTKENRKLAEIHLRRVLDAIAIEEMGGQAFDIQIFFPSSRSVKKSSTGSKQTMESLLSEWFIRVSQDKAASSNRGFTRYIKEFTERWGNIPVTEFTADHISQWITVSKREKGRTIKTIRNMLTPLRRSLNMAVPKILPRNPVMDVDPELFQPSQLEREKRAEENIIDPFKIDEVRKILAGSDGQLHNYIQFAFGCGARTNEIYGIAYEDVDFIHKSIEFRRGTVEHQTTILKTTDSRRTLKFKELPAVQAAIEAQRSVTFMLAPVKRGNQMVHYIFYNPLNGKPWTDDQQICRQWADLLRKIGIRYRPPKMMRHTFACLALAAGEDKNWVAKVMGHTTTKMLDQHYAHVAWVTEAREALGKVSGNKLIDLWSQTA